jgi:hypothetical protein
VLRDLLLGHNRFLRVYSSAEVFDALALAAMSIILLVTLGSFVGGAILCGGGFSY